MGHKKLVFFTVVAVMALWSGGCRPAEQENPYELDLTSLSAVPPELLTFDEIASISAPVQTLYGVTARGEQLYFTGDDQVFSVHDGVASQLAELGEPARCLSVGEDGLLYLGVTDHVAVLDPATAKLHHWESLGERALITSLAAGPDAVYVADAGNKVVYRYDLTGAVLNRIGEQDPSRAVPEFVVPSPVFDLALSAEGQLWVTNPGMHTLENFTPDGQLRSYWEKTSMDIEGFCGCCNPTHLAILPEGSFVTSEKGISRVKVYSPAGQLRAVVVPPQQLEEGAVGLDLAVDGAGHIVVVDPRTKRLRIFAEREG